MADVNANIGINIDTSQSLAEIKNLQRQLAQLYTSINKGSAAAAAAQKGLATNLMNTINAGGKFYAQMGTIRTSTESFTHALEKNKLTMREYFRFAGGSTKTFGRLFKSEFDTIGKVAEERVKKMQTQYIKLGRDASGAMKAISVTPTTLNMKEYGNQVAVAAQKQAILNQLLKQGSTNLLNFGKNTQWAGRQLMVGFTIPLAYFGTAAAKTFMDLEAQAIKFRRVYGDMFTTTADTNKALADIEALARQFTKYGVAVSKTMEMAASAAAMGKTGAELTAQVAQATKLSVLGNVEQEQALQTTISLTDAFGLSAQDLATKINFLNSVENQTITAIEDLTIAIPKAGPVVKQLGGSVEDLAFFLTAMREGGINASEGANALKSGLASLINPTEKASAMLADMGINIQAIVEGNAGNLRQTVIDFARALDTLAPLERSRAIEQLFGKFQFARLSTLFENVTKDGGQAARVLNLAGKSVEELAILSERELKTVEDAIGTNFREAVEQLKISIAPIGKEFLKAITPVVEFLGKLFDKFNNLGDGTKKFIVILTSLVGLIGPTLLMTFGLVANGAANIIKLFILMRQGFLKLTGNSTILAQQTQYLNTEQMEAAVVAASLNQAHTKLTQQFTLEASAVMALRNAYVQATTAAARFAAANPGMMIPGFKGLGPIKGGGAKGFNKGTMKVPGYQKGTDSVPAMLTPGEAVIPEPIAQDDRFKPLVAALVSGEIAKFENGTVNVGGKTYSTRSQMAARNLEKKIAQLIASGISEEKIIRALDKNIERGRPMTASALEKRLSIGRGSGAGTSAPSAIKRLARESQSGFINETRAIKKVLQQKGIALTPAQEKNLFGVQASHIEEVRNAGVKQWSASNLVADLGYVNNYLNTVKGNLGKNLLAMSDDQLKSLGIDRNELKALQSGRHPTTAKAAETLRAVARYDASINPRSYQANAVLAGLEYRSKTKFYAQPLRTLADVAKTTATMAVGKGEKIKTKDGKVSKVTGQTGIAKPSGMRVVGGGASDRRIISGANIASVFPRGFRGPRLVGLGAEGGFGEGATQAERVAGIKGGSISKEYRQTQTRVEQNLSKFGTEVENTTKQTKTLGQRFTTGANVFSGLTIAGSFMGGTIGDVSQKLAPFGILLSTLTMMGPGLLRGFSKLKTFFIANPVALLITALLAAVATWKYANSKAKKMGESSAELAQQQLATADRMKEISLITGQVGATELAARKAESPASNRFTTGYERGKTQFGTTFLESEFGKQMYDTFVKNLEGGGREAAKTIALELGTYISDGVLSAEQAFSIARSIGLNLKDMTVSSQIKGELIQLIGPEGTDIIKDGIKIRVKLLESSKENVQAAIENVKLSAGDVGGLFYTPEDIQAAGKLAAYQSQYLQDVNSAVAASRKNMDDRVRELEIEKQKAKSAEEIAKINDKINTLKKEQNAEEESLRTKYKDAVDLQVKAYQEATAGLRKYGNVGAAYFAGLDKTVKKRFKGTGEEAVAEQFLKTAKGTASQVFEVKLKALVAGGVFNPKTLTDLVKLFGPENEGVAEKTLELALSKKDPAKIAELVATLTGFENKQLATKIMLEATSEDGLKGKALENRLEAIARLRDLNNKEVNIEMFIQTNGIEALDSLYSSLDYVENIKGPITTKVISELQQVSNDPNMPNMDALLSIWSKYEALPDEVKKTVIQEYISLFRTVTDTEARSSLAGKGLAGRAITPAMIEAERAKISADLVTQAAKYAETPIKKGPTNKKDKGNRDTTLDELLKRLKFIRKASIDAQGGVKELERITAGKGLTKFNGVVQQLAAGPKGGFNREFISFLEGMDNATRKTYMTIKNGEVVLTKQGRALKEAFNEKVIGEYQVAQFQALQDTKAQSAALIKLQSAGVDSATALEMVADANLAVAINSKNISSTELRNMAKAAKDAKTAQDALNLALKQEAVSAREGLDSLQKTAKVISAIKTLGPGIDENVLQKIVSSPALMKDLYANIFEDARRNTEEINSLLDSAAKERTATFAVQVQIDPGQAIQNAMSGVLNPARGLLDAYTQVKRTTLAASPQFKGDFEIANAAVKNTTAATKAAQAALKARQNALKTAKAQYDADTKATRDAVKSKQDALKSKQDALKAARNNPELRAAENLLKERDKLINIEEKNIENARNLISGYQKEIEGFKEKIDAIMADVKAKFDDKIDAIRNNIEGIQRDVALKYDAAINKIARGIEQIEQYIEDNFNKPIQDLQDQSSLLGDELSQIDSVAEKVNEKYDMQADALQKIKEINQEIIDQQKERLDVAEALRSGDASAAARAISQARAASVARAQERAGGVLDAARQAEIAGIKSSKGRTRAQITAIQEDLAAQIKTVENAKREYEITVNLKGEKQALAQLEKNRADELRVVEDLEIQILELEKQRAAFLATKKGELDSLEAQIKAKEADIKAKEIEIDKLEAKITSIKEDQKYVNAQAKIETLEAEIQVAEDAVATAEAELDKAEADAAAAAAKAQIAIDAAEAELAKAEEDLEKALEAQQAAEDALAALQAKLDEMVAKDVKDLTKALEDAEAALAAAFAKAIEDNKLLEKAIGDLQTSTIGMQTAVANVFSTVAADAKTAAEAVKAFISGAFGTSEIKTNTGNLFPNADKALDTDPASRMAAYNNSYNALKGITAKSGTPVQQVADALKSAKPDAEALAKAQQSIDKAITSYAPSVVQISEKLALDAEAIKKISDGYAAIAPLASGIKLDTQSYSSYLGSSAQSLSPQPSMWEKIKGFINNAITSIDSYLKKLEASLGVASSLSGMIASLERTVTTTHIVKTINIVETVMAPSSNTNPGVVAGKMYGGMIKGYMGGGMVKPMYFANGGSVGSDTVPAMLTPGEYVVNKQATKQFAPFLSAINESKYPSALANKFKQMGADVSNSFNRPLYNISSPVTSSFVQPSYSISNSSTSVSPNSTVVASVSDNSSAVYNYNVGITVGGTNASPQNIANAVINEIKYLDSQKVKKQRVS